MANKKNFGNFLGFSKETLPKSADTNLSKIKIAFSDLTYTNQGISSISFPYGISLVASYAKKIFGDEIEFRIFKYPQDLKDYIEKEGPKILCFSNFSWTFDISYEFAKKIKEHFSDTIIIFGGPNYPLEIEEQKNFLMSYPMIDFYIIGEGEISFVELFNNLKKFDFNINKMKKNKIQNKNCHYIYENQIITGNPLERIKNLDSIPSPYLSGYLDKFFDGILIPNIQTTRGCPFCCSYCQEGQDYFIKVSRFSPQRIKDELEYIAKKSKVPNMILADSNFGMYNEDIEIAKIMAEVKKTYGWPKYIDASMGKNKETILEATKILNGEMSIGAPVQSTDEKVLNAIKRRNISKDKMVELAKVSENFGASSFSEIILCLPEDTKEAHFKSMSEMIDLGINVVRSHQLLMLPGSEISTKEYRKKYEMNTKFRLQPRCFGDYKLFNETFSAAEIDELCVSNSTMPYKDYLECRKFDLTVEIFYNNGIFYELLSFLRQAGISSSSFITSIHEISSKIQLAEFYSEFVNETENSLWNSKKELESFIKQTGMIEKYIKEGLRNNEQLKYRAIGFFTKMEEIHNIAFNSAKELLKDKEIFNEEIENYLDELCLFTLSRKNNLLSLDIAETKKFRFDFIKLLDNKFKMNPFDYLIPEGINIRFFSTDEQKELMKKFSEQFGISINGLGFILSRSRIDGFYRKVERVT